MMRASAGCGDSLIELMTSEPKTVFVGLAGLGNVGAGVYKNLIKNGDLLTDRTGVRITVKRIAVRSPEKYHDLKIPAGMITTDWRELTNDPDIPVIVELIGGVTEAYELVKTAIRARK